MVAIQPYWRVCTAGTMSGVISSDITKAVSGVRGGPALNKSGAIEIRINASSAPAIRSNTVLLRDSVVVETGKQVLFYPVTRKVYDARSGMLTLHARSVRSILERRLAFSGKVDWDRTDTKFPVDDMIELNDMSWSEIARRIIGDNVFTDTQCYLPMRLPRPLTGSTGASLTVHGYELRTIGDILTYLETQGVGLDIDFEGEYADKGKTRVRTAVRIGEPYLFQTGSDHVWDGRVAGGLVDITVDEDSSEQATVAWAVGSGSEELLNLSRVRNPLAEASRMPRTDLVKNFKDAKDTSLSGLASRMLDDHSNPITTWTLRVRANHPPFLGSYKVGDFAKVYPPANHPVLEPTQRRVRIMEVNLSGDSMVDLVVAPLQIGYEYDPSRFPRVWYARNPLKDLADKTKRNSDRLRDAENSGGFDVGGDGSGDGTALGSPSASWGVLRSYTRWGTRRGTVELPDRSKLDVLDWTGLDDLTLDQSVSLFQSDEDGPVMITRILGGDTFIPVDYKYTPMVIYRTNQLGVPNSNSMWDRGFYIETYDGGGGFNIRSLDGKELEGPTVYDHHSSGATGVAKNMFIWDNEIYSMHRRDDGVCVAHWPKTNSTDGWPMSPSLPGQVGKVINDVYSKPRVVCVVPETSRVVQLGGVHVIEVDAVIQTWEEGQWQPWLITLSSGYYLGKDSVPPLVEAEIEAQFSAEGHIYIEVKARGLYPSDNYANALWHISDGDETPTIMNRRGISEWLGFERSLIIHDYAQMRVDSDGTFYHADTNGNTSNSGSRLIPKIRWRKHTDPLPKSVQWASEELGPLAPLGYAHIQKTGLDTFYISANVYSSANDAGAEYPYRGALWKVTGGIAEVVTPPVDPTSHQGEHGRIGPVQVSPDGTVICVLDTARRNVVGGSQKLVVID